MDALDDTSKAVPSIQDCVGWCDFMGHEKPLMRHVVYLSQVEVVRLLEYGMSCMVDADLGFVCNVCRWLYALMTTLDSLLTDDASAVLRNIARKSERVVDQGGGILMLLTVRYFKQKDMQRCHGEPT